MLDDIVSKYPFMLNPLSYPSTTFLHGEKRLQMVSLTEKKFKPKTKKVFILDIISLGLAKNCQ
jgi:hypothetical protein